MLGVLAGDLGQHVPHGHAALNQLQDLLGLQLLFRPRLAECAGDSLQPLHAAAQLLRLVLDRLQRSVHRVEPVGLQQRERIGNVRQLQRRFLGEALDPGGSLFTTGH
ncbi:hypothetical protein D3C81_1924790 [compost metagenome]